MKRVYSLLIAAAMTLSASAVFASASAEQLRSAAASGGDGSLRDDISRKVSDASSVVFTLVTEEGIAAQSSSTDELVASVKDCLLHLEAMSIVQEPEVHAPIVAHVQQLEADGKLVSVSKELLVKVIYDMWFDGIVNYVEQACLCEHIARRIEAAQANPAVVEVAGA